MLILRRRTSGGERFTMNVTVVGVILTQDMNDFNFLAMVTKAKSVVEFRSNFFLN